MNHIRNILVFAHIDHGKWTMADRLIQRCGGLQDREMRAQVPDSMDIETERGITVKARVAAASKGLKLIGVAATLFLIPCM